MEASPKPRRRGSVGRSIRALASACLAGEIDWDWDGIPHRLAAPSLRKRGNWLLAECAARLRPVRPWGWPTHIQIEPTNRCNLRCVGCPAANDAGRARGFMERDLYRRCIDSFREHGLVVMLWDWGEPFLHPDILDFIAYARQSGLAVVTSSNGQSLRNSREAEKLVASGLTTLVLSIDGTCEETYRTFRQGGALANVVRTARLLREAKDKLNADTPHLHGRFIAMRHNRHEIAGFPEFARHLGLDSGSIRPLVPCADHEGAGIAPPESNGTGRPPAKSACKNPWNSLTVHWDGRVSPCWCDPLDQATLGDAGRDALPVIWRSPEYVDFRRNFRRRRESTICARCPWFADAPGPDARQALSFIDFSGTTPVSAAGGERRP